MEFAGRMQFPLLRPLVIVALETGMRRGEMLSLKQSCVDLAQRVVHLTETKNGDSRDVPLSGHAVAALKDAMSKSSGDERVFPMTGSTVRAAFDRLRLQTRTPDLRFHDLRHEAISRLFEKGLNIIEVASICGHRELKMLKRYTHPRVSELARRLDVRPEPGHAHIS
ncbi:integrase [Bradyrhizobium sp. F1.13.3]